ncbi:response regulator [uncultured Piscinibacter sp.]|uniref:response regulator transcription factor n=1 Tax=uncultured Piscinibacter sp. TaxID=1131835 RepID=UPI002604CDD8|nr:response regulator [uncultured Piscinibacter sp.]
MTAQPPVVYVVDDDAAVRKALSRLLTAAGLRTVGFDSPTAFLEGYDPAASGCAVLDIAMPGLNGLELQDALTARGSDLPIIFLTGHADVPSSVRAMKHGAFDFLVKPVEAEALLTVVNTALELHRERRHSRIERTEFEHRLNTLTPREREVMVHILAGKLNKQVAADLGTVEKTVKVHRARMMEKLQVQSLAELARLAERAGIKPASSES